MFLIFCFKVRDSETLCPGDDVTGAFVTGEDVWDSTGEGITTQPWASQSYVLFTVQQNKNSVKVGSLLRTPVDFRLNKNTSEAVLLNTCPDQWST